MLLHIHSKPTDEYTVSITRFTTTMSEAPTTPDVHHRKVLEFTADHRKALEFIEDVTANADEVQRRVLSEILTQNAGVEYLRRHGLSSPDPDAFLRLLPVVSYDDLQPDILRIAHGETSPIFSNLPISEFLTSSGTSGGERKLVPMVAEELSRRAVFNSLLTPVMSQYVEGLDKGKVMYLLFVKSEATTPSGLPARSALTSYYKSRHFLRRPADPFTAYTSPDEAVLCSDINQSMYAQLLSGLAQSSDVLRIGAVFASTLTRAIRFLEQQWPILCDDIRSGAPNANIITDKSVYHSMTLRRPDPDLAARIEAECKKESWKGIVRRLWPNAKYVDAIATGTMAVYVPTIDYYTDGLPIASPLYGSSECYFGINLRPICDPADAAYTLLPTMGYFEFLPADIAGEPDHRGLVGLAGVELGREYELLVTTYAGLYRYRVGDVLRVAGFRHQSPEFRFIGRKNVALSIDSDKTDEAELQTAVMRAAGELKPFGAALVEFTSRADTTTIPGHYVLYWELWGAAEVPAAVMEGCCLAVEEGLNAVYRQGRARENSIGPLEIRVVEEGTFDELMDYNIGQGASIAQYKTPRCVRVAPVVALLDGRVTAAYFSPKAPMFEPEKRQWSKENRST